MNYFQTLPEEIITRIFSYFDWMELFENIRHVCFDWWRLVNEPSFFTKLRIEENHPLELITSVLRNSPHLKEISIIDFYYCTDILQIIFQYCQKIVTFNLISKFNQELEIKYLLDLSNHCPNLTNLYLRFCKLETSNEDDSHVNFRKLKDLKLIDCNGLDDAMLSTLCSGTSKLENIYISGIFFCNSTFCDESVFNISTKYEETLKRLVAYGRNLTDASFTALSRCTNLIVLDLMNCSNLTDEGLKCISTLSNLKRLTLTHIYSVSSQGILNLFHINRFKDLIHLNLKCVDGLDDKTLEFVCQRCPNLVQFDITLCHKVTKKGVLHICNYLHKLQSLNLSFRSNITDEEIFSISNSLKKLQYLDISYNNIISDEAILSIINNLKELRYLNISDKDPGEWFFKIIKEELPHLLTLVLGTVNSKDYINKLTEDNNINFDVICEEESISEHDDY